MARASLSLCLICVAVAACSDDPSGNDTVAYPDGSEPTGDMTEPEQTEPDTDTTGDTDTGDTDTDPGVDEDLRFIAAGSFESVLLSMDLDDAYDVPPPEYIVTGEEIAGIFEPTPFGGRAVTHEGNIDQLRLSADGVFQLSPLASQDGNWLDTVWFGDDGANALISVAWQPFAAPQMLLWASYQEDGQLAQSFDITPPMQPGGAVLVPGRSPDSSHAVVLVDAELDDVWQIYLLPLDPQPSEAIYVDQLNLPGVPAVNVPAFLWLHIDNERVVYRKELLPNMLRPAAISIADPEAPPVNLAPSLGHISSIVWSDDNSRMVVATEGGDGYHELRLIAFDGPTAVQPPISLTEPGQLALHNTQLPIAQPTWGHAFDGQGRVYYAHTDTMLADAETVGISLVTVVDGQVTERLVIDGAAPGTQIDALSFDREQQLLGYRTHSPNLSSVSYVDLSVAQPIPLHIDQDFEHSELEPETNAGFGWSADGSRIVIAGVQQGQSLLRVGEIGELSGATVEIALPDVEATAGVTLDRQPVISPSGDQVILWYSSQADRTGLIHAPTDGTVPAEAILTLQHPLVSGAYMTHVPE